ncbi:MAG: protein-disulfide reductase DsbD [Xanthomonadales bacterium]|nr:protein-disulfide reductase DsbD [Xanthomonadales bacterium]
MNNEKRRLTGGRRRALAMSALVVSVLSLLLTSAALAIGFDEVRDYEEVFVISGQAPARDRLQVRWQIAEDYYLYNNKFLRFTVLTEGVLAGEPRVPPGDLSFDELLGEEVEKYHGELVVDLPLQTVPPGVDTVELLVRSQGCLENVLCYPPTDQPLTMRLPTAAGSFDGLGENPLSGLGGADAPLPPEQAFIYESIGMDEASALVRFTAQPGYYLYRDQFQFEVIDDSGFEVLDVDLPAGVIKDDPEFGPVQVYYGQVEIPLRFSRPAGAATEVTLRAEFQGCRDGDICYPPMSQTASFTMPAADQPVAGQPVDAAPGGATAVPQSEQDRLAWLLTESPTRAIIAFFIAGLLLAFTPCVFPMVPILSGIVAGQGEKLTTLRAFWLSLVYVLAMAVTYTVAGVLAGLFGQNLQALFQDPWIISAFVLIFILLALSMFGFYELQLPGRLQSRLAEASNRQRGGQLGGVAVMGFLSALIVGPCVAPPLMAALIVIGASGDAVLGGAALFALSMGMGVPLIIFGVSAGKLIPKAGAWMEAVKAAFGVGLLALAIWMLERILSGGVIMLLWGVLAVSCGIYLGALERIEAGASGWKRLWKSLGFVLIVIGTLEILGAAAGGDNWLRPLESVRQTGAAATSHAAFKRVKSLDDLEQALAGGTSAGRGAMLDFYADWCVECKRMERNTFPHPEVQAFLSQMQMLQSDVTAHDDRDRELMKAFGIIGPPAILFFDRSGREMKPYRLVGYFTPEEFSAHLAQVVAAQ